MKSLRLFIQKKKIEKAVRTSQENFSPIKYEDADTVSEISVLPIYAIRRLTGS